MGSTNPNKYTCPCCGYRTISAEYQPCNLCGWEFDFYQNEHPDDSNGPNNVSLRVAQQNFEKTGAIKESYVKLFGGMQPSDERDPTWKPLSNGSCMTCPCCGYKTLAEGWAICEICGWEYDPFQMEDPDDASGANTMSLREAQASLKKCGAKSPLHTDLVRRPTAADKKDPNWKPLDEGTD